MNKKQVSCGIVTEYYNNYNYGGNLQAFALQKYVMDNLMQCEQIQFDYEYKPNLSKWILKFKSIKRKEKFKLVTNSIKSRTSKYIHPFSISLIKKRNSVISSFTKTIPHSKDIFTLSSINTADSLYDFFICGSDCIWDISNNPFYSALGFVNDGKKKIAYAASAGCMYLPNGWSEKFLPYVKHLDAISVREKTIASELQSLLPDKKISTVVDPTLLFTRQEWDRFISPLDSISGFSLIYLLSENRSQAKSALTYSKKNGVKSLTFPNIQGFVHTWQRKYGEVQNYSADPFQFIELIRDSEVVITDSFHAVVFCVIYHKSFFALKRETHQEYVGRVENFLEDIGLSSQMITEEELNNINTIPKIDFSYADKVIEEKRRISIDFLKENLR